MFEKRKVVCACGAEFFTRSSNKIRCDKCQAKHHKEAMRKIYAQRKERLALCPKKKKEPVGRKRAVIVPEHELVMTCPWEEGRLPESVRMNQVWG